MKYKIQPLKIQSKGLESGTSGVFNDPCGNLLLASDEDYTSDYTEHELIVSLPRIETVDNDNILSVWLPFKHKRHFILNSKSSAFVLTRYYVDVLKCYQFRNAISNPFNQRFQKLLHEKILPFIHNEEFYPGTCSLFLLPAQNVKQENTFLGFGAILRVWETLKQTGVVVRSAYKYDVQSDSNVFRDRTANPINGTNHLMQSEDKLVTSQKANETNYFLKMIDSIRNFEKDFNERQKTNYICLAVIIAIIGLLIIILCIFIRREKRTKNINRSTLNRERQRSWKMLLKDLTRKSCNANNNKDAETDTKPGLSCDDDESTF